MLMALTGLLPDGSAPAPGIAQNSRAQIAIPRGSDARVRVYVQTPAGVAVTPLAGDVLRLTVKRSPGDEGAPLVHDAFPTACPIPKTFSLGAGALPAGTYGYRVSALTALGETLASTEVAVTISPSDAPSGIKATWTEFAAATGYKVYGRTPGGELLLATLGDVTTWLDDGSLTPSGALPSGSFWEFQIAAADVVDLDGRFVYEIALTRAGARDVVIPASPFVITPSPGYR